MIRFKIKKLFTWIRFGKITSKVIDQINHDACEVEYRGRRNKVIGYWAYGNWDPELPYHPDEKRKL